MPPRPASIKVRALQWLAQREHSRSELRAKLLRLLERPAPGAGTAFGACADPAGEVDQLLDWLTARGYLSPQRFVDSRVHARQSRYGNLHIQRELRQHGLTLDPQARQALQASEFDRAREVWRKKYGSAGQAADVAARVRQMRFMTGRGFSPEVIRRVVGGAESDHDG